MAWISKSEALTLEESQNNSLYFTAKMRSLGVNDNTIAGMLGNIYMESGINPERHEVGGSGYGLVQWTPQSTLIEHASTLSLSPYTDGDVQTEVIYHEVLNSPSSVSEWYTTSAFISAGNYYGGAGEDSMIGVTGKQFLGNEINQTPEYLARLFMCAYERPSYDASVNHWEQRVTWANYWYTYITGHEPPTPTPTPQKVKNMPLWMMIRKKGVL